MLNIEILTLIERIDRLIIWLKRDNLSDNAVVNDIISELTDIKQKLLNKEVR